LKKYKLVKWSQDLDLEAFYNNAKLRGFENNSNQQSLVDCFSKEAHAQVWILYDNDRAIGSVAAHSLDILPNAYRICARTCVLTDQTHLSHLRSLNKTIKQHQNITAQYFIPACIEWAGRDKQLYISTNESSVGSQRAVHTVYCPALESTGVLSKDYVLQYRGHEQTFWRLNVEEFYKQLEQFGKW
jgi:hypothetical protein